MLRLIEPPDQNRCDGNKNCADNEMQTNDPGVQVGQNTYAADNRLGENAKTKSQ